MGNDKEFSYKVVFWSWLAIMVILIFLALTSCKKECFDCRIITNWPEINQMLDTNIKVCDPIGGIRNFEKNNTYVDTILSDFDTYQICDCK